MVSPNNNMDGKTFGDIGQARLWLGTLPHTSLLMAYTP